MAIALKSGQAIVLPMRAWAVVVTLLLAGCSAGDERGEDGGKGGTTRPSDEGPPEGSRRVLVDERLAFIAPFYDCTTGIGVLAWDPLWMDYSEVVAFDLNLTWASDHPFETSIQFAFTDRIHGPPLAAAIGTSVLRWQLGGEEALAVRGADRMEAQAPSCAEGLPVSGAIDVEIHVEGTFWMQD